MNIIVILTFACWLVATMLFLSHEESAVFKKFSTSISIGATIGTPVGAVAICTAMVQGFQNTTEPGLEGVAVIGILFLFLPSLICGAIIGSTAGAIAGVVIKVVVDSLI